MTEPKLEVLHCYPVERVVVFLYAKRSLAATLKIANAIAKCDNIADGFPIIRIAPFESAISAKEYEELRRPQPQPPPKFEVLATCKNLHYMIGRTRILTATVEEASAIATFVRQFVYSLRTGMKVEIAGYQADREFQAESATEINQVV